MSDTLTTAQKAAITVGGSRIGTDAYDATSSDTGILTVEGQGVPSQWFAVGDTGGTATITVTAHSDSRTGTDDVTVTEEPLVVALDVPEAK